MKRNKKYRNQIHVTQNVGKVWICRKKLPAPFGVIFDKFSMGKIKYFWAISLTAGTA